MRFSKRISQMDTSDLRNVLALTAWPDIISFAGGLPVQVNRTDAVENANSDAIISAGLHCCFIRCKAGRIVAFRSQAGFWLVWHLRFPSIPFLVLPAAEQTILYDAVW